MHTLENLEVLYHQTNINKKLGFIACLLHLWESSLAAKVGHWQLSLAFLDDLLSKFTPLHRSIEADVITFTTAIGAFFDFFARRCVLFCRNSGWIFDFRWVLGGFTCSL